MKARAALAGVGLLAGGYGLLSLLAQGWQNLVATVLWSAGGVMVHDAILAPLTVGFSALLLPRVRPHLRAVAVAVFLVLATVTLTATPVLGRFGARADNPTLLDRDYWTGWWAFVLVVLLAAGLGMLIRRHRSGGRLRPRRPQPPRHG